MEIFKKKMY